MNFTFPPGTVEFLRALRENNSRSWFEAHRVDYEEYYLEPARDFVLAAAPHLERLDPSIRPDPRINGSILRINRDLRFTKDKRPYKDHLDIGFWPGKRREAASGFLFRVTPEGLGIGAGAVHTGKPAAGSGLERIVTQLEAAGIEVGRDRGLFAIVAEPPSLASDPGLLPRCIDVWTAVAPLHRWLVDNAP